MLALLLSPTGIGVLEVPDEYPEIRVATPIPAAICFNPVLDARPAAANERVFRRIGRSASYEEIVCAAR